MAVKNILCQTKRWFAFSKIGFCAGTKVFEEALNAVKFLGLLKEFGPAQNILEPIKGQGISMLIKSCHVWLSVLDLSSKKKFIGPQIFGKCVIHKSIDKISKTLLENN